MSGPRYKPGSARARTLERGLKRTRMDALAQLVADGIPLHEAGQACLGLTKGQTARIWANIKAGLGWQAR